MSTRRRLRRKAKKKLEKLLGLWNKKGAFRAAGMFQRLEEFLSRTDKDLAG